MSLAERGSVLGIDAGYSGTRRSTGFCALSWDAREIRWRFRNAGTDSESRAGALLSVMPDGQRNVLAVAIDGPLRPRLCVNPNSYRSAEALLSRGKFQKRGKPGQTNAPIGQRLHEEATTLAHFALRKVKVEQAKHTPSIHQRAVVEAFPNLFLGVLCDEAIYPPKPEKKRKWTDALYPLVKGKLRDLLSLVLPGRNINADWEITDHEMIAGFVCALSALCVAAQQFVAVGAAADGYIILPPIASWGRDASGLQAWAECELRMNLKSIGPGFRQAAVHKNSGEL